MTQTELAAAIGIPQTALSKAECGQRRLPKETVERISNVTGMPIENLRGLIANKKAVDTKKEKPEMAEGEKMAEEKEATAAVQKPEPKPEPKRWCELLLPQPVFAKLRAVAEQKGLLLADVISAIVCDYVENGARAEARIREAAKGFDEAVAALKLATEAVANAQQAMARK